MVELALLQADDVRLSRSVASDTTILFLPLV